MSLFISSNDFALKHMLSNINLTIPAFFWYFYGYFPHPVIFKLSAS